MDTATNIKCGKKHHSLLHESANQFINVVRACKVDTDSVNSQALSQKDLLAAKAEVMLQLQLAPVKSFNLDTVVNCLPDILG